MEYFNHNTKDIYFRQKIGHHFRELSIYFFDINCMYISSSFKFYRTMLRFSKNSPTLRKTMTILTFIKLPVISSTTELQ